jgi:6-phosphogluconolactonase
MRKSFFAILVGLAALSCTKSSKESPEDTTQYKILVGTYTHKGSEGIYYYSLNEKMAEPTLLSSTKGVNNPSFLTYFNGVVYNVSEADGGKVQAYAFDESTGAFSFINEQESGGAHPCHISVQNGVVYVGNYTGGNLASFSIEADGSLGKASQVINNTGSGPNKERQEKPHVHSVNVAPDGKSLWVADLGTDEVLVYAIDGDTLKEKTRIKITPGAGPRHIDFHTSLPVAYVINELNNTMSVISTDDYSTLQEISTLPEGFEGKSFCADVHVSPDGKFLYGSNRYSDNLVFYAIDPKSGKLSLEGHQDVMGQVPRNFAISPDGKYVLVANQDSDNVVIFERNQETGALKATGTEIKVSMPVCVKFL